MPEICKCEGSLVERSTTLHKLWNGEWYLIEDVPVLVCQKCGDEYYDGKVLLRVERMLEHKDNIEKIISVPVMKYNVA